MNKTLLIIIVTMSILPTYGQSISGKVVDSNSKKPIPYVSILLTEKIGTSTDLNGDFSLSIHSHESNKGLKISCIGYKTVLYNLDSLLKRGSNHILQLTEDVITLKDLVITENNLSASDLVLEAINKIDINFNQKQFNLFFDSKISVEVDKKVEYEVFSKMITYRDGYKRGMRNHSKMLSAIEKGNSPIKQLTDKKNNVKYFKYELIPFYDIFLADMVGVSDFYESTIFNRNYLKKINLLRIDTTTYDGSHVIVIKYSQQKKVSNSYDLLPLEGLMFISASDLGIVRHQRRIGDIYFDVRYRKYKGLYYPYFVKSIYPEDKVKKIFVSFEAVITNIELQDVEIIDEIQYLKNWHLNTLLSKSQN
jgi:hypothetical protein